MQIYIHRTLCAIQCRIKIPDSMKNWRRRTNKLYSKIFVITLGEFRLWTNFPVVLVYHANTRMSALMRNVGVSRNNLSESARLVNRSRTRFRNICRRTNRPSPAEDLGFNYSNAWRLRGTADTMDRASSEHRNSLVTYRNECLRGVSEQQRRCQRPSVV